MFLKIETVDSYNCWISADKELLASTPNIYNQLKITPAIIVNFKMLIRVIDTLKIDRLAIDKIPNSGDK